MLPRHGACCLAGPFKVTYRYTPTPSPFLSGPSDAQSIGAVLHPSSAPRALTRLLARDTYIHTRDFLESLSIGMEDFFKTGKWTGTGWMQTHKITNAGDARLVLSLEAQILTTFTASSFENVEGLPQRTGVGGVATDIVAASSCSHRKGSRSMSSTAATTSRRGLGSREASKKKRRVESDALDGASSASSTSTELPLGRYLASPGEAALL